jgi:hypothetical protein
LWHRFGQHFGAKGHNGRIMAKSTSSKASTSWYSFSWLPRWPHGRALTQKCRVRISMRCTRCQDVRRLSAHGKPACRARPTVRDRADASSRRRARTALARALLWLVAGCGLLNLMWLAFCASDRLAPSPCGMTMFMGPRQHLVLECLYPPL